MKRHNKHMASRKGFKQITFSIPDDIWRQFSHKVIDENKTKIEVLISLLKKYIKN